MFSLGMEMKVKEKKTKLTFGIEKKKKKKIYRNYESQSLSFITFKESEGYLK